MKRLKKNFYEEAQIEQNGEITQLLDRIRANRTIDLEAWEAAVRSAVFAAGADVLSDLLSVRCAMISGRVEDYWEQRAACSTPLL